MSTLCLISLSIKDAANRASKETFGNITNSFSMEINRRVNFGTPRGGGNIKGEDIKKIAESKDIDSYIKRPPFSILRYKKRKSLIFSITTAGCKICTARITFRSLTNSPC